MLVSRAADNGVLGLRSLALRALFAPAMPAAATAASMTAAAHHKDHAYTERQPNPVLR